MRWCGRGCIVSLAAAYITKYPAIDAPYFSIHVSTTPTCQHAIKPVWRSSSAYSCGAHSPYIEIAAAVGREGLTWSLRVAMCRVCQYSASNRCRTIPRSLRGKTSTGLRTLFARA